MWIDILAAIAMIKGQTGGKNEEKKVHAAYDPCTAVYRPSAFRLWPEF